MIMKRAMLPLHTITIRRADYTNIGKSSLYECSLTSHHEEFL